MKTLFVGTAIFSDKATESLSEIAIRHDANAQLITKENCHSDIEVGYTGIEEFDDKNHLTFLNLVFSAEEVYYCPDTFPPTKFDLYCPQSSTKGYVEYLLLMAKCHGKQIHNSNFLGHVEARINRNTYLNLVDKRKQFSGNQLWGVGCSYTYGDGVTKDQRYIDLVGKQLGMDVNLLALSGTSISWAADQILRSDIQKNDIVVWGLTERSRFPMIVQGELLHLNINYVDRSDIPDKKFLLQLLANTDQAIYQQLTSIHQVINFCDKIGAHLVLLGLITLASDLIYLHDVPNFYQCNDKFIDFGTDGIHPGPKQHQCYADIVIKILKERNII